MTTEQVLLAGRTVSYTLTVSSRARHPRLIIARETGLRVVTPLGYDPHSLQGFIERHQGWILTHLDRLATLPAEPESDASLPPMMLFLGTPHAIRVIVVPGERAVVHEDQAFTLIVPEEAAARPALEGWLRARARVAITAQVKARAKEMMLTYGQVAIKDQKTRWGSCSAAGNLNFNWRLLLAPPAVLDYVVVHELAHRVELNHSARFWRVVARYCPQHATHRAWLRTHGAGLRF